MSEEVGKLICIEPSQEESGMVLVRQFLAIWMATTLETLEIR